MQRIPRNPVRFDVFRAFATRADADLHDQAAVDEFKESVATSIKKALDNPKFLYGQHVEAMFQGVVIALGRCQMIKEEDVGGGWYDGDELGIPDYRIVLHDSTQFLVEVKNHNGDPMEISFTETYINGLRRYGELTCSPVKLAVYWVGWRTWTLVPLDILEKCEKGFALPFVKAVPANEFSCLGDMAVATRFPLTIKFMADRSQPRSVDEEGQAQIVIGDTKLFCRGEEIFDREREIAFMLMTGGTWEEHGPLAELDTDGTPNAIVFEYRPREDHGQGFEIIGSLSEIFSSHFQWRTLKEQRVSRIAVDLVPGQMANLIPKGYKGKALPLWRFILQPSHHMPMARPEQ
jgi:hypothetical protein